MAHYFRSWTTPPRRAQVLASPPATLGCHISVAQGPSIPPGPPHRSPSANLQDSFSVKIFRTDGFPPCRRRRTYTLPTPLAHSPPLPRCPLRPRCGSGRPRASCSLLSSSRSAATPSTTARPASLSAHGQSGVSGGGGVGVFQHTVRHTLSFCAPKGRGHPDQIRRTLLPLRLMEYTGDGLMERLYYRVTEYRRLRS